MTAVALVMAASCEKPAPQPGPQPDPDPIPQPQPPTPEVDTLKENSYRLDDETYTFQSVAVSNLGENIAIAATPSKDVNDFQSIFEQEEYFYVAVSPLLNGSEFDLMTETGLYTVISTLEGAYLETVAPSMTEEIQEGKCSFNYAGNKAVVTISITLADGAKLEVSMSAEEAGIIVNENIFSIDGNDKPVRTAFYQREDGMTAIYLTPAGIDFFEDLEIVTYYAYIILEDSHTEYVLSDCKYKERANALVGELSVLKDGKAVSVADDVVTDSICYLDGKQVMYISDEDLCLWNGSESRKIANNVLAFWASSREACDIYAVY